jgi:C-terminal processing protease CtpA/Prc
VTVELTPLKDGEEPRLELAGIGASLEKRGEAIWIGQVLPGGGAAEAGLVPGDGIMAIEGAPVEPMSLGEAVQLLRGPEGTSVTLSVVKASGGRPLTVSVPRRLVRS